MQKGKHQHSKSLSNNKSKIEYSSKHVKKQKHSRKRTELVGMTKANANENVASGLTKSNTNAFDTNNGNLRGIRRNNVSMERTFDIFGMANNQNPSNVLNFNATGNGLSNFFRTMNGPASAQKSNFVSAAQAMGGDIENGVGRTSSIFARPFGITRSFHARHNSENITKVPSRHFETEIEEKSNGLEENKFQPGNTFDERVKGNGLNFNQTLDIQRTIKNRRTNSVSFNFGGNPFHFRRTLSKVPTFMDRKKVTRQLSIQK